MENAVRYLSKEQVAATFNVSLSSINRYVKEGLLPAVKVGKFVRFEESVVKKVIESLKKKGGKK